MNQNVCTHASDPIHIKILPICFCFVLRFVTCNLCKLKYKKITEVLYDDIASLVIIANDFDLCIYIYIFGLI